MRYAPTVARARGENLEAEAVTLRVDAGKAGHSHG